MSKTTKYFELFSALKAGGDKGVSPDALAKTLNFSAGSLAVYIHALRHKFGAVVESVRNGRTVVAYRLVNVAEMEAAISPNRKPRTTKTKAAAPKTKKVKAATKVVRVSKTKKVKAAPKTKAKTKREDGPVEVLDADLDIAEITDRELDDIRDQLGIA